MSPTQRAIVLLSGGLDSATTAAIARNQGFNLYALSFDYGQRHRHELESARRVAAAMEVREYRVIKIDLAQFGGSALTTDAAVPKDRSDEQMQAGIPVTYVPARNTVFLSFALAYAEVTGAADIFIGLNAIDYSGYPDCRPEFVEAFERTGQSGHQGGCGRTTQVSDSDAACKPDQSRNHPPRHRAWRRLFADA